MHIALIEEELPIQDIVRHALELGGHQVETYYKTPEKLHPYDLVIIEPGEDGHAFPPLHQHLKCYHPPVLILTFYEQNIDAALQQQLPILRKIPFRLASLLKMVDTMLMRSASHRMETNRRLFPRNPR
jgi:DNA-binding response OmpR family regulator